MQCILYAVERCVKKLWIRNKWISLSKREENLEVVLKLSKLQSRVHFALFPLILYVLYKSSTLKHKTGPYICVEVSFSRSDIL
jgi:hypothetical protein